MEHFIVSARKYRPQTFQDVVGQQAITNTLENAIKNNHLAQALLFTGPRGVGKTTCARILAKKINQDGQKEVDADEDFAFNIFELDAASNNSVDDIRNLTEQVRIPPQTGHYKVYIIDEVHMLSAAAFNAFLKTLEEPPAHAIFILATTEKHKIIPTILSRCQIFDFKRIGVLDMKNYLKTISEKENITAEDDALHIIAQKADGALRDALSIFDRVVSFSGNKLTRKAVAENLNVLDYDTYFEMTDLLLENKIPEALTHFDTILSKGFEGHHFINGIASHFRNLLVAKDKATIALLEVGDAAKKKYLQQSEKASLTFLIKAIEKANDCDLQYKVSRNQRLLVELTLMQIASITFDGEKKKHKRFIIPASYFISNIIKNTLVTEKIDRVISTPKSTTSIPEIQLPKRKKIASPSFQSSEKRKGSALSLKSIHAKKETKKQQIEEDYSQHPRTPFSEESLQKFWKDYADKMELKGEKIIASILNATLPTLENNVIQYTLPNTLMKADLERNKNKLIGFLREKLNNYGISLNVLVNEEARKKYAYTPQEKYEKMKAKNPNLALLRKTFDLDL